jgi:serine/threonine-protein phosphatase 2A regulatory subunit A
VRVAAAGVLTSVASVLGKDKTVEHIVPLFVKLLKDDWPEVRLNIISKLEELQTVTGPGPISSTIVPEIVSIAEDPQWRVRMALVERIPLLAKNLGLDQFDKKLTKVC